MDGRNRKKKNHWGKKSPALRGAASAIGDVFVRWAEWEPDETINSFPYQATLVGGSEEAADRSQGQATRMLVEWDVALTGVVPISVIQSKKRRVRDKAVETCPAGAQSLAITGFDRFPKIMSGSWKWVRYILSACSAEKARIKRDQFVSFRFGRLSDAIVGFPFRSFD